MAFLLPGLWIMWTINHIRNTRRKIPSWLAGWFVAVIWVFIQFEVKYHLYFGEALIVSANFGMQPEVTKFFERMPVEVYIQIFFAIFDLVFCLYLEKQLWTGYGKRCSHSLSLQLYNVFSRTNLSSFFLFFLFSFFLSHPSIPWIY